MCEIENGLVTFIWISYLCVHSHSYIEEQQIKSEENVLISTKANIDIDSKIVSDTFLILCGQIIWHI